MSTTLSPKRRLAKSARRTSLSADRPAEEASPVQRIRQTLRQSPYSIHRQLTVQEDQGQIVLEGQVESYFQKQMAQELVLRCCPQSQIDNRIQVRYRGFCGQAQTASRHESKYGNT